ncbi:MAG: cytochrome c-type biogenesis protein CcmH, partial [Betaproteobacteria bacterium]|nr:cytochrome c-type biogenesis protein CcmH [Betaproteobacteria bacterium]
MKYALLVACLSVMSWLVQAGEAQPMAQDPQVEARLVVIAEELRCLVC